MKIPKKHKEVILKKVNVLIKEFLVNRYLKYGENADNYEHVKLLVRKMLETMLKIKSDEDVDIQFLIWVDREYKELYNENMGKQV